MKPNEPFPDFYSKHYIKINQNNLIVYGWSDGPHPEQDTTDAICINEQGGYQFQLFPDGEENPPLYDIDGIPLYKFQNNQIISRTNIEIETDRMAIPEPLPSIQDKLEAQITYTAMMTDTLLEE